MQPARECYGRMFPSVQELKCGGAIKGHVFAYEIERTGWVTGERTVTADLDSWRECTRCADFELCRQLSMGKLLLEIGVGPSGPLH